MVTGAARGIGRAIARRLAAEHAQVAFGDVDVLVNCAGGVVTRGGTVVPPSVETTAEELRLTLERNLLTMMNCTLAVLPHMAQRGCGRIVSVGSDVVRNGWRPAVYGAAKGGVHGFTTGLAREYATSGVTVNVVSPAVVITPEVARLLRDGDREQVAEIEAALADVLPTIPAGRAGTADEMAAAVAYLASEEAAVTGQIVSVNGGSAML